MKAKTRYEVVAEHYSHLCKVGHPGGVADCPGDYVELNALGKMPICEPGTNMCTLECEKCWNTALPGMEESVNLNNTIRGVCECEESETTLYKFLDEYLCIDCLLKAITKPVHKDILQQFVQERAYEFFSKPINKGMLEDLILSEWENY